MDKETIEILKNPHIFDEGEILDVVSKIFSKVEVDISFSEFDIWLNDSLCISRNLFDVWGKFYIKSERSGLAVGHIEHLFEYPLLPTKEEKEMFFIEFGEEYPIPVLDTEVILEDN